MVKKINILHPQLWSKQCISTQIISFSQLDILFNLIFCASLRILTCCCRLNTIFIILRLKQKHNPIDRMSKGVYTYSNLVSVLHFESAQMQTRVSIHQLMASTGGGKKRPSVFLLLFCGVNVRYLLSATAHLPRHLP